METNYLISFYTKKHCHLQVKENEIKAKLLGKVILVHRTAFRVCPSDFRVWTQPAVACEQALSVPVGKLVFVTRRHSYSIRHCFYSHATHMANRPLTLRDHVTNASSKQWFGILLMPKIDRAHKNYLTPEIWDGTHLRDMFYGTLIFQQSSMICIGRHVGGHTLALKHGGQKYFLLYLAKRLIVMLRCAVNVTTSSFQHFPRSLSAKFVFRKR